MSAADLELLLRAAVPPAPDRLRARIAELRPAPRRLPDLAPRRLLLVAAPVALALVVGAAVVHGLASPGPKRQSLATVTTVGRGGVTSLKPTYGAATADQGARSALVPSVTHGLGIGAAPAVTGGQRLTQYEASLRVRVAGDRLSRATTEATRVARSVGGYAASVDYTTPAGRSGQAVLELRIPTRRVQDALVRLAGLGTILSQRVSARDLQQQLERETAQIAQLRQTIQLTLAALKDPAVSPVQRIQLQLKLAEAKQALAQRTHQRGATVAEGTLARVSLVLTTAQPQGAVHAASRLSRMMGSAVSFLGLEATIALYALVVVSPLVPLALLLWGAVWARRRRDEKRLLAVR